MAQDIKTAKSLLKKLKDQREQIYIRIRIYSEQKLQREVDYLNLKIEILGPIIWDLEGIVDFETESNKPKVNVDMLKK